MKDILLVEKDFAAYESSNTFIAYFFETKPHYTVLGVHIYSIVFVLIYSFLYAAALLRRLTAFNSLVHRYGQHITGDDVPRIP